MDRIQRIFRLVHLSLWTVFILLVTLQLSSEGDPHWPSTSLAFIASALYVFYTHFYLLNRHRKKQKKATYLLYLAGIVLTGPIPFLVFHHTEWTEPDLLRGYYGLHLGSTLPIFLFLSWLARITQTLVLNTIQKEQLEKQAAETELHYLKSQINPHFLFNTLNNIHTLVYKQAPAAPDAVIRLASLMRYMIYESNGATVPLSREIDYLRDYMHLQQLRYREAPVADMQVEGDVSSYPIAPLLFIHLLDNAYKHSPANLPPGALRVHFMVTNNLLSFTVQNPVAKGRPRLSEPSGIGLPNIRKRLSLLYPGQHELVVREHEGLFTAHLTIRSSAHEREAHLLHR